MTATTEVTPRERATSPRRFPGVSAAPPGDGKTTLWLDSFDWHDVVVGPVRGLTGAVVPSLTRPWPGEG
jgi:hypothetical protein